MKKNIFAKLALIAIGTYAVAAAAAAPNPATTTFQVLFKVNNSCSVAATNLDLGVQESTGTVITAASTGSVTVTCTKKTPYTIGMLPSNANAAGAGVMAAQNVAPTTGNSDTVSYALYSNLAMTSVWGNTVGTNTVAGTGTGAAQPAVTVYGKVTSTVNVTADNYADTVTVNVAY